MDPSDPDRAPGPLGRFVGAWTMEATLPGGPPVTMGGDRSVFEWMDGGQFPGSPWTDDFDLKHMRIG